MRFRAKCGPQFRRNHVYADCGELIRDRKRVEQESTSFGSDPSGPQAVRRFQSRPHAPCRGPADFQFEAIAFADRTEPRKEPAPKRSRPASALVHVTILVATPKCPAPPARHCARSPAWRALLSRGSRSSQQFARSADGGADLLDRQHRSWVAPASRQSAADFLGRAGGLRRERFHFRATPRSPSGLSRARRLDGSVQRSRLVCSGRSW